MDLLTLENVGERLENGLTLLHLCCISRQAWAQYLATREAELSSSASRDLLNGAVVFSTPSDPHSSNQPPRLPPPRVSPARLSPDILAERDTSASPKLRESSSPKEVLKLSPVRTKDKSKVVKNMQDSHTLQEIQDADLVDEQESTKASKPQCKEGNVTTANSEKPAVNLAEYCDNKLTKCKRSVKLVKPKCSSPVVTSAVDLTSRDPAGCVKQLLQKGADTAIISKNGFSPLHLAAYQVT